jgi:hypothetical protein
MPYKDLLYKIDNTQGYNAYRGSMPTDQSMPVSAALGQSNNAPLADISAAIIGQLQELLSIVTRLNKQ